MSPQKKGTSASKTPPAKGGNVDVWGITTCNTTRKALKFYESNKVSYTFKDLKVTVPPKTVLRAALKEAGSPKQVFNSSGNSYQEGNYKDKVDGMTGEQIVDAMIADPMLIKRPLVKGPGGVAAGFDEEKLKRVAK